MAAGELLSMEDQSPKSSITLINWITTSSAEMFFACTILVNAAVIGIDIEVGLRTGGDSGTGLFWIQFGFAVLFTVELIWQVLARGLEFFKNVAGLFDTVIIGTTVAEYGMTFLRGSSSPLAAVSVMRVFRLLRIVRIVRLLHICDELSKLISGLVSSIKAVAWVFCFLVVFMYICALVCTMELGQADNEELRSYFGSVPTSFYTHFMIVTLEGYPDVVKNAATMSWLWYFYFVAFIVFSGVVLMNVVTGIVCESVVNALEDDTKGTPSFHDENLVCCELLENLIQDMGYGIDCQIFLEDFQVIISNHHVRQALNTIEICLVSDDKLLWGIITRGGGEDASLTLGEMLDTLPRLRGTRDMHHSLQVQADLLYWDEKTQRQIDGMEKDLVTGSRKVCNTLQVRLLERIVELQGVLEEYEERMTEVRRRDEERSLKAKHRRQSLVAGSGAASSSAPPNAAEESRRADKEFSEDIIHLASPPCSAAEAAPLSSPSVGPASEVQPQEIRSLRADVTHLATAPVGSPEDEDNAFAATDRRVMALIELAEKSGEEAQTRLERIGRDLTASQSRIRELENRLRQRSEEAQTEDLIVEPQQLDEQLQAEETTPMLMLEPHREEPKSAREQFSPEQGLAEQAWERTPPLASPPESPVSAARWSESVAGGEPAADGQSARLQESPRAPSREAAEPTENGLSRSVPEGSRREEGVAESVSLMSPSVENSESGQIPSLRLSAPSPQQHADESPLPTSSPVRQRRQGDLRQRMEQRLARVEEATKKRVQKADKVGKAEIATSGTPSAGGDGNTPRKVDRAVDVHQRRQLLSGLRREYAAEHRSSARKALRADSSDEEDMETKR